MPANAMRGIGRWVETYCASLIRHHPGLVTAVSIDGTLPIPSLVNSLPLELPVLVDEEPPGRDGRTLVFHQVSPFEDLDLSRIWPAWARRPEVALVVTIFDVIPLLFPGDHFQGPLRHLLRARCRMVESADAVVAISSVTAKAVRDNLDVRADAVCAAPPVVADRFVPYPEGRQAAFVLIPRDFRLQPDFILSVGNIEPRKNLPALIEAYARLRRAHRQRHQLVITCSQAGPEDLDRLRQEAERHGVSDRVVLISYVDDSLMLRLYQACYLMVFPSLYEGLGLPVIEAMRSGAATLASDIAPINGFIHNPSARFNPADVEDMRKTLHTYLADAALTELRRSEGISDAVSLGWKQENAPVEAYNRAARRRP